MILVSLWSMWACLPVKSTDTADTAETVDIVDTETLPEDTGTESTDDEDTAPTAEARVEHCGTIDGEESWSAAEGPHYVTCDLKVRGGGSLTIGAGAEVYFVSNASLLIGDSSRGVLIVDGSASDPVVFAPDPDSANTWEGLQIQDEAADVRLEGLILRGAGGSSRAALVIDDVAATLTDVTIEDPVSVGLELEGDGRLVEGSAGLTVTGAQIPIRLPLSAAGELPAVTLTGNTSDVVQITDGAISASVTLPAVGVPYWVDDDIEVEGIASAPAVLTIEAGVELRFAGSRGLAVSRRGGAAGLVVDADGGNPVIMGPWEAETAGAWDGVGIYDAAIDGEVAIRGLELRYGGDGYRGNLYIDSVAGSLDEITLTDGAQWGLYVEEDGPDFPTVGYIVYANNASGDYNLDASEEDTGLDTGAGDAVTEHCGTITGDEAWTLEDSPHYVTCDVRVRDGGALTIGEGVEVYFSAASGLTVGDSGLGTLVVAGHEGGAVLFAADPETATTWDGVSVKGEAGLVQLEGLTILGGGATSRAALTIDDAEVTLTDVTIEDPANVGLEIEGDGRLSGDSAGLTVTGAQIPIQLPLSAAGELPAVTLTGNTSDVVQITNGAISASVTLPAVGVPYWVDDDVEVEGTASAPAVLTIEAGVELRFDGGKALYVSRRGGAGGLLIDASSSPVVMAPWEAETAGAWDGIGVYDAAIDGEVVLDGLEIHYGGDGLRGNLYIESVAASLDAITLSGSAQWGLYVEEDGPDFPSIGDVTYADNADGDYNLDIEDDTAAAE